MVAHTPTPPLFNYIELSIGDKYYDASRNILYPINLNKNATLVLLMDRLFTYLSPTPSNYTFNNALPHYNVPLVQICYPKKLELYNKICFSPSPPILPPTSILNELPPTPTVTLIVVGLQ